MRQCFCCLAGVVFQKSSYSGQNAQCVEVAHVRRMFGVRDSKNPVGPVSPCLATRAALSLLWWKRPTCG